VEDIVGFSVEQYTVVSTSDKLIDEEALSNTAVSDNQNVKTLGHNAKMFYFSSLDTSNGASKIDKNAVFKIVSEI